MKQKKPGTKLAAISIENDAVDNGAEHIETLPLWPMMAVTPTPTSNKFSVLEDDDGDNEENEVLKALAALTPNVQRASDKARPQRAKKSKTLNIAHLNSIARMVKSGEIQLPDLDLEDDDEYDYIWAMVDSGAGANVARREHIPGSRRARSAPRISLTIANGDDLPNRGARVVTCYDRSGSKCDRLFYEAPVEMPILSVTEISKEGKSGSEVRFRLKDGEIIDNATGKRCHFVKRMGVYFMRLYFPKSASNDLNKSEDVGRLVR
jgi:hypothetical protein